MIYATLFVITMGLVFVKAFQQRNVAHGNVGLIIPTSDGSSLLLCIAASGSAAAIGCTAAVGFHRRITRH